MVGMIFGGVCLFAYTRKNFRTFAIFSATAICALALAGPSVIREFSSSFEENLDESAHSRFHIWSAGLNLTADYPLLGVGPFAGEKLMVAYYPVPTTKPAIHLHNLPLEIATGSGLVALIGYVAFFFIPIYKLHKFLRQSTQIYTWQQGFASGTLASLLAYWLASLFNSGSLIEIPYIVVALAIAMVGIEENNTTTEQMHVPSHVDCLQGEH
jgi:O-antigen ligase